MQYIDILDVNIYHLQLFIYTVECGSMTKAAHLAHVSQSMLSKTISKLEQKFGLQLFVRKNNGLSVTPAGKILYDEEGMGTVEVILIILVLIGLVIIFKSQLTDLVESIFTKITKQAGTI